MKYATIILVLLLTIACKNKESNKDNLDTKSSQEQQMDTISSESPANIATLQDIKTLYEKTHMDVENNRYTTRNITYDCNGERGGKVTYYYSNTSLRLIEHSYNAYSHNEATNRYYIINNQPYFIYYKDITWQFDGEANQEGATKDDITEHRYYLINNRLEQCLEKTYTIRSAIKRTDPSSIQNTEISCPTANLLLEDYYKLLEHINATGNVGCI